jgi:acetoin utilization protein AcuB
MIARNLLTDPVLPLKPSDTGATALGMMDEYRVAHLPIVDNLEFVGLISDADIYSMNSFEDTVGNHPVSTAGVYVHEEDHIYEAIKEFHEHKLTLLPVLTEKNHYMGAITLQTLVGYLAKLTAVDNPGGIIVLEVNEKDYSLSEIARIVESNDAKVLSLYLNSFPDSTKLEITLKLNRIDIGPLLQTFHRYDYIIRASFSDQDAYNDDLQDRFDSLMNYLNI